MAYTDPIPANYNSSSIMVNPGALNDSANAIGAQVQDIANCLGNINTALSDLTLSWLGSASKAASTYNNAWNSAVQALFGTESDPSTGALNILMSGLSSAALNYSASETAIAGMFDSYANSFPAVKASTATMSVTYAPAKTTSSGSSSGSSSAITDTASDPAGSSEEKMYHTTSVNES